MAVASHFKADGVAPERIYTAGLGQNQPVASNTTPEGRRLNRRVDITIVPITEG
jgi:outer membrane protein OmpA-like peptidoglycan-associated protein